MTWTLPLLAAAFLLPASTQAQSGESRQERTESSPKRRANTATRNHYYAAQASLYAALAHASALEQLAQEDKPDMDMARSHVHTVNRELQACKGESVKLGQALHSAEKEDSMKELRKELSEAARAIDSAQNAVDGHGALSPHCKNNSAHLLNAVLALAELGEAIGVQPLSPPGVRAMEGLKKP
jgi:hypothetical protein